jgi:hypothetical protein
VDGATRAKVPKEKTVVVRPRPIRRHVERVKMRLGKAMAAMVAGNYFSFRELIKKIRDELGKGRVKKVDLYSRAPIYCQSLSRRVWKGFRAVRYKRPTAKTEMRNRDDVHMQTCPEP